MYCSKLELFMWSKYKIASLNGFGYKNIHDRGECVMCHLKDD